MHFVEKSFDYNFDEYYYDFYYKIIDPKLGFSTKIWIFQMSFFDQHFKTTKILAGVDVVFGQGAELSVEKLSKLFKGDR